MATETNDMVPELPQPEPPKKGQQPVAEKLERLPDFSTPELVEAKTKAWMRRRDPYAEE